ncbi:MAG: hypothetical protein V1849_03340 [Chloroflexota bacterium]
MGTRLAARLMFLFLALLLVFSASVSGCGRKQEGGPLPETPSPAQLSATRVPNLDLDVYIYIRQERPTTVPGDMIQTPASTEVVSLSAWGLVTGETFTFGLGLLMASPEDARKLHAAITPPANGWKMLSGNLVFYVQGTGGAFESLKNAISNGNFKYFDDKKVLDAVATLPAGGNAKLAGVAVAKPHKELVKLLAKGDSKEAGSLDGILTLARLEVMVAGLYSPQQIDLAKVRRALNAGNLSEVEVGLVALVQSGLPGFIVEPIVKRAIAGAEFTETRLGDLTVYQRDLAVGGKPLPLLARVNGSRLWVAVSPQKPYTETLISGVK